jgi:NAD(P)H-nitrite reductase large subunit
MQGRIAGLAAAVHAGFAAARSRGSRFRQRFVADMTMTYAAPAGALPWAEDGTLICRCEEVALGAIRTAIAQGDDTVDRIKSRTRSGMGHCQARQCGPLMQRILAGQLGTAEFPPPGSVRPPLKPVPVADLCALGPS